jgi:acetoin:2,6-dichlorophenolindophenol oxidoreductase subunit beta
LLDFRNSIAAALAAELEADDQVIFYGEDVAAAGGVFAATSGLKDKFPGRVFDTPISELAIAASAFGSAVCGMRPVVEIMFGDFLPLAMDSLINQAAKYWYISNGQASVPLVVRCVVGGGARFGAIHSQMPVSWLFSVPGLKIFAPSDPLAAFSLLRAAIRDDNPVVFMEHKRLYSLKSNGAVWPQAAPGRARVIRNGSDLTIVSCMVALHQVLQAADSLATHGISCEVIDLQVIRPPDRETILESAARTKRVLVVEEGPRTGGWAAEILASLAESALGQLESAWRLTTPDQPVPYSPPLEDAFIPNSEAIVASVLNRLGRS